MSSTGNAIDIRGYSRRSCLRAGALALLGLSASEVAAARRSAATVTLPGASRAAAPRARSCVFIFLFGGPSHIDLWDRKPAAPVEIRGEFRSIATRTAGIELCEHLPKLAQQTDSLCLLRSLTHHMPVHGPACSELYTGREYFGPPITDQATPQDWPSLASLVTRYGSRGGSLPNSVVVPWYTQFVGQDKPIAGQSGGRMGEAFDPFVAAGDPRRKEFDLEGLAPGQDCPPERMRQRRALRHEFDRLAASGLEGTALAGRVDAHYQTALEMVEGARSGSAFRLDREPATVREQYGATRFGQSLLLARRLVEAGVSLVTVNWDDDHKDDKVSPHWDTHADNFPKLKDRLCPPFDQGFAAFLADLRTRGLLESTLVVAVGEFGRTPRVGRFSQNAATTKTGRDHWPHAFTALLAGGGVRGGQVYGETNESAGYVADRPVSPADLAATVFAHLGIDRSQSYDDRFLQVRQPLCIGRPIALAAL